VQSYLRTIHSLVSLIYATVHMISDMLAWRGKLQKFCWADTVAVSEIGLMKDAHEIFCW
jgi:hypothetical protein